MLPPVRGAEPRGGTRCLGVGGSQEAWQVPGLLAEAARLGGGIMQIAHAGTPEQVLAAEQLLQRTRRELYRILAGEAGGPGQHRARDLGRSAA